MRLKVALLNPGLFKPVAASAGNPPGYAERSDAFGDALKRHLEIERPDLFLLTEVWHQRDFNTVAEVGASSGYRMLEDRFRHRPTVETDPTQTGLAGLVCRSQFERVDVECVSISEDIDRAEFEIDASFGILARAALHASLTTHQGVTASVYLVHLTPQLHDPTGSLRRRQSGQLASLVARQWRKEQPDLLIVGGDFNFSALNGQNLEGWDAELDQTLYHDFILKAAENDGPKLRDVWTELCGDEPGWTIDHGRNPLSRTGSSGDEPDRRVDMIFIADGPSARAAGQTCRLIFDEPLEMGTGGRGMLSDHFGLECRLAVDVPGLRDAVEQPTDAVAVRATASRTGHADRASSGQWAPEERLVFREREPSEPVSFLQEVLDSALVGFDLPDAIGVMVIGSVAEGFGNAYSDLDFLVVSDQDEPFPTMRHMFTYGERRCEFFFRTSGQLADMARSLVARGVDDTYDVEVEESLDLYHRVCFGYLLRNASLIEKVRALFDREALVRLVVETDVLTLREQMSRAWLLLARGQGVAASIAAKHALTAAASAFAASAGETYTSRKFIFKMLRHARAPARAIERFRELSDFMSLAPEAYLPACLALIREFGWREAPAGLPAFELLAEHEITAWDLGETGTVLLRGADDLYALSKRATRFWTDQAFGVVYDEKSVAGDNDDLVDMIDQAHSAGLVRVRWRETGRVWATPLSLRKATQLTSLVPVGGTASVPAAWHFAKYAQPAKAVVGAALDFLSYANHVENDDEDAVGAAGRDDWDLLSDSLRRRVLHACMARLSVQGVYPIDMQKDESHELVLQLGRFPETKEFVQPALQHLNVRVRDRDEALTAYETAADFVERLLGSFLSEDQRQVYSSAAAWFRTLKLGTEWAMLADRLGVSLPLDEFTTLVSVAQGKEKLLIKQQYIVQQLGWTRRIDFVRELEKQPNATP